MSEKKMVSGEVPEDLVERAESITDNRSHAMRRGLEMFVRANSSGEQRLDEIEDEIAELDEKQDKLEEKKRMLRAEREMIQEQLEREEEEREAYKELVDELAEQKANGYRVLDSEKFGRALSLSDYSGDLAVEMVLDEIRAEADVDDTDEEVIEETADDYDFDLNTSDSE